MIKHLKYILTLTILLVGLNLFAQTKKAKYGKAKYPTTIVGKILDSITLKPVPYCIVTIEKKIDIKKSKYTSENGTYEFQGINKGNYNIYLSYLNHKNLLFDSINVQNYINVVPNFYLKIDTTLKSKIIIENCNPITNPFKSISYTKETINYIVEFEKIFIRNNSCLENGYIISTKRGIVKVDNFMLKTK